MNSLLETGSEPSRIELNSPNIRSVQLESASGTLFVDNIEYVRTASGQYVDFEKVAVSDPSGRQLFPVDTFRDAGVLFAEPQTIVDNTVLQPGFVDDHRRFGASGSKALGLGPTIDQAENDFTFVLPGTSTPAVTDFFQATFLDAIANAGTSIGTLEAFDINGQLISSQTATTPSGGGSRVFSVAEPGIARVRLIQDEDGGRVDDLFIGSPTPIGFGPSLITNGSFETSIDTGNAALPGVIDPFSPMAPIEQPDGGFFVVSPGSTAIEGWETFAPSGEDPSSVDWKHDDFLAARDGVRSLDLNGSPGRGGVRQVVSTKPGAEYELHFAIGANTFVNLEGVQSDDLTHTLEVRAAGDSSTFDLTLAGDEMPPFVPWSHRTWRFTATSDSTILEFLSLRPRDDLTNAQDFGPMIDSVMLFEVPSGVPGDYNNDGAVDAADYTVWRDNLGAPRGTLLNDPVGGIIGVGQYEAWRTGFGGMLPSPSTTVPEPAGTFLLIVGLIVGTRRRGVH